MAAQDFKNHVRYYTTHHFIFYPLLLIALWGSVRAYNLHPEQRELWIAIIAIFIFIGWTSFMMRQHYGLGNQNRIVRMELRFRYYILTGKRLELFESNLSFSQLAALRFASDAELASLVELTLEDNLTPLQIKKSIINWSPDYMRV